jgi:hypothetical protein
MKTTAVTKLEKPTSQIAEALYTLLTNKSVSRKQFLLKADILNAPESVRQLKNNHGVGIVCKSVPTKNKFGRMVSYGTYSLTNVSAATKVYKKLNKLEKATKK